MAPLVHYELELNDCLSQPLCENHAGRDAYADINRECEMSPFDEEVTCQRCLKALGYALPEAITAHVHAHGFASDADVHSRRAA